MSESSARQALLTIDDLRLVLPNGRVLFDQAHLQINKGEFTLVVGPSGAGKSTLLQLLAGIESSDDAPEVSGHIRFHDELEQDPHSIGIVFQNLALFDELTALENIQFAIDHDAAAGRHKADAGEWLARLQVPSDVPLARLSGGERQRVALARTLARDPVLILFDEPTTGLDPTRARAVVDLIMETQRASKKTILVVTHDFEPFLRFQPRLVLVDPHARRFRDVSVQELQRFFENDASPAHLPSPERQPRNVFGRVVNVCIDAPGAAVLILLRGLIAPFQGWTRWFWKVRYLWHFMRMVLLGSTAVYVALAGVMLGFVSVTFTFKHLPYGQVTRPLLTEEFLAATGYSAFRVVVPLLVGLLIAGKCAAAVAADIGARRLTNQFEAMRSMNVAPPTYFLGNIVTALSIAGPVLTFIAFISSSLASLIAYLFSIPDGTSTIFWRNYFATLWPITHLLPKGFAWVVLKSAITGFCVGGLAYLIGSIPKASSVAVSRDVGRTIFWGSLVVLLLHSVFSFIEF